mmetsp:Transcript_10173/g.30038  ORF Transcript_10173/g.30038 Transcript_10173/m.30038 type:complete len:257 (+) Transcript_10173:2075-2845(+)
MPEQGHAQVRLVLSEGHEVRLGAGQVHGLLEGSDGLVRPAQGAQHQRDVGPRPRLRRHLAELLGEREGLFKVGDGLLVLLPEVGGDGEVAVGAHLAVLVSLRHGHLQRLLVGAHALVVLAELHVGGSEVAEHARDGLVVARLLGEGEGLLVEGRGFGVVARGIVNGAQAAGGEHLAGHVARLLVQHHERVEALDRVRRMAQLAVDPGEALVELHLRRAVLRVQGDLECLVVAGHRLSELVHHHQRRAHVVQRRALL